jgi:hypothetical protein
MFGTYAGLNLTDGINNAFFGAGAGQNAIHSGGCAVLGANAFMSGQGRFQTATGYMALEYANQDGNTATGCNSLSGGVSLAKCTGTGYNACPNMENSSFVDSYGYGSGDNCMQGYLCAWLGNFTGCTAPATCTHRTAVGPQAICDTDYTITLGTASDKLQKTGIPVYANNAAATVGGLVVGMFYRTGTDPDHLCVVH